MVLLCRLNLYRCASTSSEWRHDGQQTRRRCNGRHRDGGDTTHGGDNDPTGSSVPWHDRPQRDGWLHDGGDTTCAA